MCLYVRVCTVLCNGFVVNTGERVTFYVGFFADVDVIDARLLLYCLDLFCVLQV